MPPAATGRASSTPVMPGIRTSVMSARMPAPSRSMISRASAPLAATSTSKLRSSSTRAMMLRTPSSSSTTSRVPLAARGTHGDSCPTDPVAGKESAGMGVAGYAAVPALGR